MHIVKPIMVEELTQDTVERKIMIIKPFVQETDLVIQTQSSQVDNTPFLSIIIPTYNEASRQPATFEMVPSFLDQEPLDLILSFA